MAPSETDRDALAKSIGPNGDENENENGGPVHSLSDLVRYLLEPFSEKTKDRIKKIVLVG